MEGPGVFLRETHLCLASACRREHEHCIVRRLDRLCLDGGGASALGRGGIVGCEGGRHARRRLLRRRARGAQQRRARAAGHQRRQREPPCAVSEVWEVRQVWCGVEDGRRVDGARRERVQHPEPSDAHTQQRRRGRRADRPQGNHDSRVTRAKKWRECFNNVKVL